jgi:hypothetical protein
MCLTLKSCKLEDVYWMLRRTVIFPDGGSLVAGEYDGKYYMIDWVTRKLSRITLGAYKHVSIEWGIRNRVAAMAR